jgi:hypothetical protein
VRGLSVTDGFAFRFHAVRFGDHAKFLAALTGQQANIAAAIAARVPRQAHFDDEIVNTIPSKSSASAILKLNKVPTIGIVTPHQGLPSLSK